MIGGMRDYSYIKAKAIKLRQTGLSYGDIKKKLNVSKSTLSLWLKEVALSEEQKKRLYTNQISILSRGPQSQKERRKREIEKILEKAKNEIPLPISSETYRFFGAALYWAEGTKGKGFEITNSDPILIAFIVKWFKDMFSVRPEGLGARLNIYPQQNDLEIKKFWSDLTGIPLKNFGKSFIKPLNKNYKKNNLYYGTIKVRVKKGTNMKHRLYGWVMAALEKFDKHAKFAEKKWISLRETPRPVNL